MCKCPLTYWDADDAPSNSKCIKINCIEGCELCHTKTTCEDCIDTYYLTNDTNICV